MTQWIVTEAPTLEKEGLSRGNCDLCGLEFTRVEPVLETVPTEPPTEPPATAPAPEDGTDTPPYGLLCALAICLVVVAMLILLRPKKRRGGKYAKKRR